MCGGFAPSSVGCRNPRTSGGGRGEDKKIKRRDKNVPDRCIARHEPEDGGGQDAISTQGNGGGGGRKKTTTKKQQNMRSSLATPSPALNQPQLSSEAKTQEGWEGPTDGRTERATK